MEQNDPIMVPDIPPLVAAPAVNFPIPIIPAGAANGPPLLPPPQLLAENVVADNLTVAANTATVPPADASIPQAGGEPIPKLHPTSISFDSIFSELQTWKAQNNGSLTIPTSHPALSRITDVLTSVGIKTIVDARWEEQISQLVEYHVQNGNCNVPLSHPTLGKWTANQRDYYKLYELQQPNPLTPSQFSQLESLSLTINRWEKKLEDLKSFKLHHGHCDVPIDYPQLGVWVLNQRETYHFEREDFLQERVDALDALGFNWNRWGRNRLKVREDAWEAQFCRLLDYMKEHGHSNISQHDKENERLGKWLKNQRYEYRKYHNKELGPSRLGRDRIDKLNEIGFQWRLRPERIPWDDRFKALIEFKEAHGHCRVPMSIPELGKWAKYQRDQYCLFMRGKKAKISQPKVDKLLSIGFEDSLEERVTMGLDASALHVEMEHHQEQGRHQQQHHHHQESVDHAEAHNDVAYQQHHGGHAAAAAVAGVQPYTEHYHHGDPNHAYGGEPAGGSGVFHYQHGGVHYHT